MHPIWIRGRASENERVVDQATAPSGARGAVPPATRSGNTPTRARSSVASSCRAASLVALRRGREPRLSGAGGGASGNVCSPRHRVTPEASFGAAGPFVANALFGPRPIQIRPRRSSEGARWPAAAQDCPGAPCLRVVLDPRGAAACSVLSSSPGPGDDDAGPAAPRPVASADDGIVERNVMVPLHDGVRLTVDVYRPSAPGKVPVVMVCTPYGTDQAGGPFVSAALRQGRLRHPPGNRQRGVPEVPPGRQHRQPGPRRPRGRTAGQQVHHSARYPSQLILPIIPAK